MAEIQAEMGDERPTVTWSGASLPTLVGSGRNSSALTFGGFAPETDRVVIILNDTFIAAGFSDDVRPSKKDDMAYDPTGQVYVVNEIILPMGEQQIHYGLVSKTKGVSGR